jgi:3-mercaptopyruvate sulfurtransferase SseA
VYCARPCPNEVSEAVAAKHLSQAEFEKIRPLLGGIDAWVKAGQPLEHAPPPRKNIVETAHPSNRHERAEAQAPEPVRIDSTP